MTNHILWKQYQWRRH